MIRAWLCPSAMHYVGGEGRAQFGLTAHVEEREFNHVPFLLSPFALRSPMYRCLDWRCRTGGLAVASSGDRSNRRKLRPDVSLARIDFSQSWRAYYEAVCLHISGRDRHVRVGVPKEIKDNEYHVGIVPSTVRELVDKGHWVVVETRAGAGAGFADSNYQAAGAEVVTDSDVVFDHAELIVKVNDPLVTERKKLSRGQVLFTYLHLAPDRHRPKH